MTNRIIVDPNALSASPSPQDIRKVLIDLYSLVSVFVTRETLDYAITGNVSHETVIMANTVAKTVTMKAEPEDLDQVTVIRTDAKVTINGNGKNIADNATLELLAKGDAPMMVFSADDATWWPA